MTLDEPIEDVLRREAPHVLGAVVRRYGHFDLAEDAVQESLVAAVAQWPAEGWPRRPRSWLIAVAARRLIDRLRSDDARRRREDDDARLGAPNGTERALDLPDEPGDPDTDDTLTLLFMCCHPALSPPSQLALTLRAVGGLSTAEIARAFLVPEATMAQRISRAKKAIADSGEAFALPPTAERTQRLDVVLHVLYLIFNEGYTTSSGADLQRSDLTTEAIRLARMMRRLLPDDGEVAGLLALMLLTDARRPARSTADGRLVPLAEQDRSLWNDAVIDEGVQLVTTALQSARVGPYQLQAAIAAVHDEAPSSDDTDWAQIVGLYQLLDRISPNPMATLNRAVAVAMVDGPAAGLAILDELEADERMSRHHRLPAVRGHLLEMAGDLVAARSAYELAARRTTSVPEQRYLESRAAHLPTT